MGQILSYQCFRTTEYMRIERSFVWEWSGVARKPAWYQKAGKTIKNVDIFKKQIGKLGRNREAVAVVVVAVIVAVGVGF